MPLDTVKSVVKLHVCACNGELSQGIFMSILFSPPSRHREVIRNSGYKVIESYKRQARRSAAKYRERCATYPVRSSENLGCFLLGTRTSSLRRPLISHKGRIPVYLQSHSFHSFFRQKCGTSSKGTMKSSKRKTPPNERVQQSLQNPQKKLIS